MNPGRKGQRGVGVPEIMQTDDGKPGLLGRPLEKKPGPVGVQGSSCLGGKKNITGF